MVIFRLSIRALSVFSASIETAFRLTPRALSIPAETLRFYEGFHHCLRAFLRKGQVITAVSAGIGVGGDEEMLSVILFEQLSCSLEYSFRFSGEGVFVEPEVHIVESLADLRLSRHTDFFFYDMFLIFSISTVFSTVTYSTTA